MTSLYRQSCTMTVPAGQREHQAQAGFRPACRVRRWGGPAQRVRSGPLRSSARRRREGKRRTWRWYTRCAIAIRLHVKCHEPNAAHALAHSGPSTFALHLGRVSIDAKLRMIQSSETEAYFSRMLAQAGFSEQKPDPLLAWQTFQAFSAVPVDCAGDDLLFQCGVYGFTGRELFHFGFVRQFTFEEEDGEYGGMEQLDCAVLFEPDPELRTLETSLWSSEFDSAEEFFAAVEALPEFQALRGRTPVGLELVHDEV